MNLSETEIKMNKIVILRDSGKWRRMGKLNEGKPSMYKNSGTLGIRNSKVEIIAKPKDCVIALKKNS